MQSCMLGFRKIPFFATQIGKAGLEMHGHRIIHFCPDSGEIFMVCLGYDIEIKYDLKFICLFVRPNFLRRFFR